MSIKFTGEKECLANLAAAMQSGDEEKIQQAWVEFHKSVVEQVKNDAAEIQASNDAAILANRGYRQLTSRETKWYQKVIEALNSKTPKQAFTAIIGSDNEEDIMPTTIIEDVYKELREEHPLLKAINFRYVGYLTRWVLNDHATQTAVWGTITDEIAKEITSAFRVVKLDQNKLSAFAIIEKGMLDLGPTFLDGYIRTVLKEALYCGAERAIIKGTGVNEPIGLMKDIHAGVAYNDETGYPDKSVEAVTDFTPASYGALVAKLVKTEKGKMRKFDHVGLIVNMQDYLTKIMPATTLLTSDGRYARDLFPFPTTPYISNEMDTGKAILFLENEYFYGAGGGKDGVIEYSDEYKFIEDQRVFKIKQYGAGRAFDNTVAVVLDISNLDPAYVTVLNVGEVTA